MATVKKTTKKKTSMSARDRMIQRKEDLKKRGQGGGFNFIKEGTTRIRLKSPGDDKELGIEIIQFYLGKELGGIISPATFDEPCPFMERYKELKDSDDEEDNELAKTIVPRRRFVIGGIGYKDEKGKEIDPDRIDQGWLVTRGIYEDIIDLYLDEDEWGDMTDPIEGYDIKLSRTGSGMTDTTYSCSPCQKKPLAKEYRGEIDLETIVRNQIKSYDELEKILNKFLNHAEDDEEEEPKPKKKTLKEKSSSTKKKVNKTSTKKKKKKYDDDDDKDLPF